MKLRAWLENFGISLAVSSEESEQLTPSKDADQESPRRHYVYGHIDADHAPFYIGKGKGKRAWDKDRHPLWHRYVNNHLGGKFTVVILTDDLDAQEAERLESEWIAQESSTLVNWVNLGRKTDFKALERFHHLRDANRKRIDEAKALEKSDVSGAIDMYFQAIDAISEYAGINAEKGSVGRLLQEEKKEAGLRGELSALDRLTICLKRSGRKEEAASTVRRYFEAYRADLQSASAQKIMKRVGMFVENAD